MSLQRIRERFITLKAMFRSTERQFNRKSADFLKSRNKGVLRTGQGRAEVLLTPGVFLRIGENSAIKLLDNRLVSTRVEILSGTVIVESDDPQMSIKDSPVALIYKDYEIRMVKHGLWRSARIRRR